MPSRRDILIGATGAVAAILARPLRSLAGASQPKTAVNFIVPPGACDCHTHIFGDEGRFPFAASRTYTPEPASIEEMRTLHRALHTERVVIVQPSVYGTDNRCTLDAVKQFGRIARGIAVVDDKTPKTELDEMGRAGIRGIRINLETSGEADPGVARERFRAAVDQVSGRNWHIQIYTRLSVIEAISEQVLAAPVPVVFDHFGGAQAALGTSQKGFDTLLKLLHAGKAYVKLSAPYRSSTQAPNYADVTPLAKALIAANPRRVIWGSDWPHPGQIAGRKATDVTPLLQIDDGNVLNQLAVWAPDAKQREMILTSNPAKLYGFETR